MNKESLGFLALTLSAAAEEYKERLRGEKGDKGEKGDRGDKGPAGKDGYTPRKGVDFRDGRDGKDGAAGKDGLNGLTPELSVDLIRDNVRFVLASEKDSLRGEPGKPGPAGIPGMRMRGEWKQGEKYGEGDLVALGGDIWYAGDDGPESRPGRGTKWKLFLRSQAGRISGYGVVQSTSQPGGIGQAVAGGTANRVLFIGATGLLADSANLTYTETSGPRLQVGSGVTTSAGFISGYLGVSNTWGLWGTGTTGSITEYAIQSRGDNSILYLRATNDLRLVTNILKFQLTGDAGRGPIITAGTATTDVNALSATQTWNASGVAFTGWKFTITDTSSAAGSLAMQILGGAAGTTDLFSVGKGGLAFARGLDLATSSSAQPSNSGLQMTDANTMAVWSGGGVTLSFRATGVSDCGINLVTDALIGWNTTTNGYNAAEAGFSKGGPNQIVSGAGVVVGGGSVTSNARINKAITAFTDAAAKTVFTLTIPNAAHSASYLVRVTGSLGAGGAIGANEASATNCYVVTLTRTAGVNATAAISAAFGAAATAVAGAATVTCTAALAAVSGGVGASNTIDIQATITRSGGSSDNHTCVATASLLNANATGITIA